MQHRTFAFGLLPLVVLALAPVTTACSSESESESGDLGNVGAPGDVRSGTDPSAPSAASSPGNTSPSSTPPGSPANLDPPTTGPGTAAAKSTKVKLVPQTPSAQPVRVNFAIPFARGGAADPIAVRVRVNGADVPASSKTLARHTDGSVRSVQIQFDLALPAEREAEVELGVAGPAGPAMVPVANTLVTPNGDQGPRVWALLAPEWLTASRVAGPMPVASSVPQGPMRAWQTLCDYASAKYATTAFVAASADKSVWLYDRGTAFYRGYVSSGAMATLRSAYLETSLYRAKATGTGNAFRIGVPGAADDLKYHYAQNLAIHYLLTGDDRFREAAESVATRAASLWNPSYDGSSTDFWTERNAGFLLLAQVWAGAVTDDRAAAFRTASDATFDALKAVQSTYPVGYTDPDARCFAHHGDAHDSSEGNPYFGCSPWMSAILADGLDAYAREASATRAADASLSIARLGRMLAKGGAEPTSLRPYYWMGVGGNQNAPDDYEEHRGETAYVIAMAWHHAGRNDATLRAAADKYVKAFSDSGEVGQLRSFNWQCRSGTAAPAFLLP